MQIKIADKTLCQKERSFSFKEKLEIARQLEKLNVDVIELPKISSTKADTLLVKTVASFVKNSIISVAVELNKESIDTAALALSTASKPSIRIEAPVSTVGMEYFYHKKADKMLETVTELIAYAKQKVADVEFVAVDATRAEGDVLKGIISGAIKSGANTITVCDTAAEMLPDKFGEFVKSVADIASNSQTVLGVCCDNKNSLAAANAVTSLKSGAVLVKTDTAGSLVPLEAFVDIIKNCGAAESLETAINHTELKRIINQINWIADNGKSDKVATSITSLEDTFSFTANDSAETIASAVLSLGYDLTDEDINKVYEEFLRVAEKKSIASAELDAIVASVALQVPSTYKLVSYVINSGNILPTSAQITLKKDNENLQGISIGDGPINSAFLSIEQIIGNHFELDDFKIKSVTEGKEAMGQAIVRLRQNGKLYSGNGISTDIIEASIKAYLNAVNKIVYEEEI